MAILALGLGFAPAASAYEEIGNPCAGDATETEATMLGVTTSQRSEPWLRELAPPEGRFVITRWRVQAGAGIGPLAQRLIVYHYVNEDEATKLGESALETIVPGSNEFATHIPIPELARIGLWGPEQTLICHREGDIAGRVKGEWPGSEARPFEFLVGVGVPLAARIERDSDGDGFGDETEDGCPTSSALQTPCPLLTVSTRPKVKPHAVLIRVTTSNESAVQVLGQVRWQEKRPGGGGRLRTFGLGEKAPRLIPGGGTEVFRLRLWDAITRQLDQLPPKRSLRVKVRVGVTDVFHAVTVKTLNVRLHGRAQS